MSRLLKIVGVVLFVVAIGVFVLQQEPSMTSDQLIPAPEAPKIAQAKFTKECTVELTIGAEKVSLPTSFDPEVAKCDQYSVVTTARSGKFVAFEDLSAAGVDSVVSLYDLNTRRLFTLDDYGDESVFDLAFLPNDRLLVLYGQGLSGTQRLRLYDLPSLEPLLKDVPADSDLDPETLNPFVFERTLADLPSTAKAIRITDTSVVLVDESDNVAEPLYQIPLAEL